MALTVGYSCKSSKVNIKTATNLVSVSIFLRSPSTNRRIRNASVTDSSPSEMDRYRYNRQPSADEDVAPRFDDEDDSSSKDEKHQTSFHADSEGQEPFMGVKFRRKASLFKEFRGDYLDVPSQPSLMNLMKKQGDSVFFADKVLKFTSSGKIKRRIFIVTDVAFYIIDPETHALKRRVTLPTIERVCLSELNDNFFAVIIPTEYDLLMASMRKTEIVTALADATRSLSSSYELDVQFSNRIVYHATAEMRKEVQFEEAEGGVKTRILTK